MHNQTDPPHESRPQPGGASAAPSFGTAIRHLWPLEDGIIYLNHGTVGVTPHAVLEEQTRIRLEIERNPARVLLREIGRMVGEPGESRIRQAAETIASFLGARGEDLVFVGNATEGVNAVLLSLDFQPGDQILITETTYGGVRQAVQYLCRRLGLEPLVVQLPCPIEGPGQVVDCVRQAITDKTRLAILDHIVSPTGVVLPVAALSELCHQRGVLALIDGAHAPGQLALNIPSVGADFYVGNLHKWAFAPRSCGILWANPEYQPQLHPPVISWGLDQGFTQEFDWTGTRDPSAALSATAGIDFLRGLSWPEARRYNSGLLSQGVEELTQRWNGCSIGPPPMTAFMAAVSLPATFPVQPAVADRLRDRLLFEHGVEIPIFELHGQLWARLSVQVYNTSKDFDRLAVAIDLEQRSGAYR